MINASLFDAGMQLRRQPSSAPGVDTAWWAASRTFEESLFEFRDRSNLPAQNAAMRAVDPIVVSPWPERMPAHMWVDWTPRHAWNGIDGLGFNLWALDTVTGEFPLRPAGEPRLEMGPVMNLDREASRFQRELAWREVRDLAEDPTDWYRADTLNESGGTHLVAPVCLRLEGLRGPVVPELVDNSFFEPFDLRAGTGRYQVYDSNGTWIPSPMAAELLRLEPRGIYNLYLRPRRWRYFIVAYVVYIYVSFLELFYVNQAHTHVFYDAPPRYPYRHDILSSTPETVDPAVLWEWEHSQAAADLTAAIFDAEWRSLCEAFLFSHVDHLEMWVYRYPPQKGEYVLGIGRVDRCTGREAITWVQNRRDLDDLYPQQQLAYFEYVPWYILPAGY